MNKIFQELAKPFDPEYVKWRVARATKNGKLQVLCYIDARHVMDRLDAVIGPSNWQTEIEETPKGRVLCHLSLYIDNGWVKKTDGAGNTAVEGEKGAISDALKRAAVQFGIGRYLYSFGNIYANPDPRFPKQIAKDEIARLQKGVYSHYKGEWEKMKAAFEVGPIDEETVPEPPKKETQPPADNGYDQEREILVNWEAQILAADTIDELKSVHGDMTANKKLVTSKYPDDFELIVSQLQDRKKFILEEAA